MKRTDNIADLILETVSHSPGCHLDEVIHACPEFSWNQVFLEIDRLSRRGELLLKLERPGVYSLRLPDLFPPERFAPQSAPVVS
jgi:hypothetical protein